MRSDHAEEKRANPQIQSTEGRKKTFSVAGRASQFVSRA